MNNHGYFGVGIFHPKHECNQGTLWRSCFAFGASFCFTIGPRFTKQASDTANAYLHVPMLNFDEMDDMVSHLPYNCPVVGVELDEKACPLDGFVHPDRCVYLLGAEDHGLPAKIIKRCHMLVQIEGLKMCLNVSTVGSILMYDRQIRRSRGETFRHPMASCNHST